MSRRARERRERAMKETPLPESLECAFEAVENLDAMHPSSRGQAFGAMIYPASHEHRARTR